MSNRKSKQQNDYDLINKILGKNIYNASTFDENTIAIKALKSFAKQKGYRLQDIDCYNANVGEVETKYINFKCQGYKIQISAANTLLYMEIKGFESDVVRISVNKPDKICFIKCPFIKIGKLQIYTDFDKLKKEKLTAWLGNNLLKSLNLNKEELMKQINTDANNDKLKQEKLLNWLSNNDNINLLYAFKLGKRESIQIFSNGANLIFLPSRDISNTILALCRLADKLPRPQKNLKKGTYLVDELVLDPIKLPEDLRYLVPLIRKWSVGDDEERVRLVKNKSKKDKIDLVSKVSPYFKRINSYLDSFNDKPVSEEAILLGYLAEVAAEVKLDLGL